MVQPPAAAAAAGKSKPKSKAPRCRVERVGPLAGWAVRYSAGNEPRVRARRECVGVGCGACGVAVGGSNQVAWDVGGWQPVGWRCKCFVNSTRYGLFRKEQEQLEPRS